MTSAKLLAVRLLTSSHPIPSLSLFPQRCPPPFLRSLNCERKECGRKDAACARWPSALSGGLWSRLPNNAEVEVLESSWNSSFAQVFHEKASGISTISPWLLPSRCRTVGMMTEERTGIGLNSCFYLSQTLRLLRFLLTSDLSRCLSCRTRTPGGSTCTSGDRFSRGYRRRSSS